MVKLIHSVAQEYRSVLCEFTFMSASQQCILSLFQPCIYTANWHLSARGVRKVMQTQYSLALKKWMRKEAATSSFMWLERFLISDSTSRLESKLRGCYFKQVRSYSCSVVQKEKKKPHAVAVLTYWDLRVCAWGSPCGRGGRGWCVPPYCSDTELGVGWVCTQTLKEILVSVA